MTNRGNDYTLSQPIKLLEDVKFTNEFIAEKGVEGQIVNIVNADEIYLVVWFPYYSDKGVFVLKNGPHVGPIPFEDGGRKGVIKEIDMFAGKIPTKILWDDGEEELLLPEIGEDDEMPD